MNATTIAAWAVLILALAGTGYLIWRFRQFIADSWRELRLNVTWPSRREVVGTTWVVLIMVGALAVFLFSVDAVLHISVQEIVRFFSGVK